VKLLLAALLVAVLALPASAGEFINDGSTVAYNGHYPIQNTFFQEKGDVHFVRYGTDASAHTEPALADTKDICIGSGGMPAWFLMQVKEEVGLEMFWVRKKESVDGMTHSYTWGDWVPILVDGAYREYASNAGLWDSLQVVFCAATYGSVDVYCRMEMISDD